MLLNYSCSPDLLAPLVPKRTVLDSRNGETLVSLVGFLFTNTRVRGLGIPFHRTFEEVNLRFYVRRTMPDGEVRRAVVFVRELVPRWLIAGTARWIYNEPYEAVPMEHRISLTANTGGFAEYSWLYRGEPFALRADAEGPARSLVPGSEAQFITEHYWGYTVQRDGGTLEYKVEHPAWQVWEARVATFSGPASTLYGRAFGSILNQRPRSAFLAVGSDVVVNSGVRI